MDSLSGAVDADFYPARAATYFLSLPTGAKCREPTLA